MRALALALLVGACGTPDRAPVPAPAVPVPAVPAPADAAPAPPPADAALSTSPIPPDARQLITAVIADWDATTATLQRYERSADTAWAPVGAAWTAVIGRGAAWGIGLHGDGPPTGQSGARKAEGDGRSPAGAFALLRTFGYAATAPAPAGLPYRASTASLECVDDPTSSHYNAILERPAAPDWTSSEAMRRDDDLYRWVVEVGHNAAPAPTPRAGSCIFLHVWRDAASPTVGCTAMPAPTLRSLIGWLVREQHPTFVLLPRSTYIALAAPWDLPALR